MQKRFHTLLAPENRGGNLRPAAGASVTVTDPNGALATIYSDNGVTEAANPLTSSATGYYEYYAADGRYTETIVKAGRDTVTLSDILLEDPADSPAPTSADMASTADSKGAGLVGFLYSAVYAAGTLGKWLQDLANSAGASFIGFIQLHAGSVLRSIQDVLRERVSIKDFGAIGDGVTDDTAAIQAALDAVAGRVLFAPKGTYLHSSSLTLSVSNATLRGEGGRATVFKRAAGLAADVGGLTVRECGNIKIAGIGFDGNKANQSATCSGLSFASASGGVSGVILKDVDAFDWGESTNVEYAAGITLYGASKVRISGCNASGNAHYGINAYECDTIQVHGCQSSENGRHGFGAAGTMRFVYTGNVAEDNGSQGFWFRNVEEGLIANNIVRWSAVGATEVRYGIQVKRSTVASELAGNDLAKRVLVTGNTIIGASDSLTTPGTSKGVYLQANAGTAQDITVSNNMIVDCDYGTYAPSGDNISFIGNTVLGAKNIAMWDDGINNAAYLGNVIRDCMKHGIYSRCRYGSIKNNVINSATLDTTATYYGIWYADRTDTVIANNDVGDLNVATDFLAAVYLSGAFATRVKVYGNMLKNTSTAVLKSGDFGTSGSGNGDWDNFNSSGFGPYADHRYVGRLWFGAASQSVPSISSGAGSPEGVLAAQKGSMYLRTDGGAATSIYVKESGTGNTGWVAK